MENLKGADDWEPQDSQKSEVGECGLDSYVLRRKPVADSCVQGNELPGFIKGWEFLDCHSEY
jgi:hypothetical protein